jgi:hypothetical protein
MDASVVGVYDLRAVSLETFPYMDKTTTKVLMGCSLSRYWKNVALFLQGLALALLALEWFTWLLLM